MTEEVARAAIGVVEASCAIVARSLRDHAAPAWDDAAGQVAAVESAIIAHADGDGWVARTVLLRACRRMSADSLDRALARLLDEDRLEFERQANGKPGRPTTRLRLVNG